MNCTVPSNEPEYVGNRAGLFAKINEFGVGKTLGADGRVFLLDCEHRDLFRRGNGKRAQQGTVHDAENGGVRAYTECDGDCDYDGHEGRFA